MYSYSSSLECKYFLVGTIVRRGVGVEVGVEIHVESFCAETPDCVSGNVRCAVDWLSSER